MNSEKISVAARYQQCAGNEREFVPPDEIARLYDVLEQLSENECGETYLLAEKSGGKFYVLKCYRKSETGKNVEADILRGLNHKGLPCFKAEYENEETFFVLRDFIDGIPLDQCVMDGRAPDEPQAIKAALELCDILAYLHAQTPPIIHRDIKPSNIIINPETGAVSCIDFGISRRFSKDAKNDTVTFGTHVFSPPEQYGFSQTDCRADIYALGVVMRFMLTGKVDGKIKNPALERISEKCAAFAPKDRFQNAKALKKALMRYSRKTKKKIVLAVCSAAMFFLIFSFGMIVGRYTGFLSAPMEAVYDEPYIFTEPLIEEAVRLMLEIPDGQAVTRGDLDDVAELYIVGKRAVRFADEVDEILVSGNDVFGTLSRLDDLREMKNLRLIYFYGQAISDLTPLADCVMMTSLDLARNPITDLSPLASLPQLSQMNIIDTQVRDFSPLDKIASFKLLWIGRDMEQYLDTLGRGDLDVNVVG